MDTIRTRLRQRPQPDEEFEGGGAGRVELRFVAPEAEEEAEAGLSNDITELMQGQRRGKCRTCALLCVGGVVTFTAAFLLAYVLFSGRYHFSKEEGQEDRSHPGNVAKPAEGGAGLYLGHLREMMKRLLQEEDIFNTVSRVSRASHPPGSPEGTSLASEILGRFRNLKMDHTWVESLYATLQFPHRSQRSSLWLVDSAGQVSEQIPLNPSDFCPYSASGTVTGGMVYANYGRPQDFKWLKSAGVSVDGSVVVMRVGGGASFAEKVRLAESYGAGGALIYPDPADLPQDPRRLGLSTHTAVSEHVHLGSGDPFTPGFPSFNHTQFPPVQSSGLPTIPVLPISATVASKLLSRLSGPSCPPSWWIRLPYVRCVVGPEFNSGRRVKMSVHNVMTPVLLNNVFSSLDGRVSYQSEAVVKSSLKPPVVNMDTIRTRLRQRPQPDEEFEGGGAGRVELRFVAPEAEEEAEAGLSNDITELMQGQRRGKCRTCALLCVGGVVTFTAAFLLAYVLFSGRYHFSKEEGQEDRSHPGNVAKPAEGGAGLYLGHLREMMKRLLQEEDIFNTVSRVSRASHPPGSPEGTSLASEILGRFRNLKMDHTWVESLYATLQFPHRSQRSSLWLVDSAGQVSEQIPLNPSDFCPYSASGTVTGGMVYANYGRPQDFKWLKSAGVSVDGSVVVMRVGGGASFAEKVRLAESYGAGGALIYPDPADLPQDPRRLGLSTHTAVSEHVHLGSGDPFTPGFPSFNHTQFPPVQSSGLPTIPVLPISATVASKLLSRLSGPSCPPSWWIRLPYVRCVVGPEFNSGRRVKMSVHNVMTPVLLNNVFSSLDGRVEPDQYIILGAQRDSLSPGAVKSGVGTAILLELARTFTAMVKNGFSPRRSLLFVSWDAGDFGNVGATEWLEGYLSMLHLKAVAYFSLDQAIMGDEVLSASSSPLLIDLLDAAIRQVEHPKHAGQTIYSQAERDGGSWRIMKPLYLNSGAYSFTAFAGVPAVELRFTEERTYPFVNTPMDTASRLQEVLGGRLGMTGRSLGELVGEMVLRLAHDHILPLRITSYAQTVLQFSAQLNKHSAELQSRGLFPQWLFSARGDYSRAAETLQRAIDYSDMHDPTTARSYNNHIMRVEYYFLSQYVSVVETPFRHVIHGRGNHTLSALTEHLALLTSDPESFDEKRFRRQLAFFTWTLQGAAHGLSRDIHKTHTYTQR